MVGNFLEVLSFQPFISLNSTGSYVISSRFSAFVGLNSRLQISDPFRGIYKHFSIQ